MALFTIFNQILVLFLLMGTGYCLAKKNVIDKACADKMTFLLCYVVMPCVILSATCQVNFDPAMFHNFLLVALFTAAIHIITITVSHLLFNKKTVAADDKRCILQFSSIYSNCGFMGFPLLGALLGAEGIFYGSAYNCIYAIFLWTHGFLLYNKKLDTKSLLSALLNPNIIMVVVGTLLYYYSIKLPTPITSAVHYIADLNTALSMIIIGTTMTKIPFSTLFSSLQVFVGVLIRNIAFPLLILLLLVWYGVSGTLLLSLIILSACPVAGLAVLFAQLTEKDTVFPAKTMTLSTLFTLISMPVIINLAKMMNP